MYKNGTSLRFQCCGSTWKKVIVQILQHDSNFVWNGFKMSANQQESVCLIDVFKGKKNILNIL